MQTVVIVKPGEPATIEQVADVKLKTLQDIVGGLVQDCSFVLGRECKGVDLLCNEEGLMLGLKTNIPSYDGNWIVGNVVAVRVNSAGEWLGLTDKQAELVRSTLDTLRA